MFFCLTRILGEWKRRHKTVVRLSALEKSQVKTRIGGLKGQKFKMNTKFDDPTLNSEIAKAFNQA